MRLDDECRLSYYQQIASLNDDHNICLVQNVTDKKVYVKKILTVYNLEVFRYLQEHPIANMPHIYEIVVDSDKLIVIEEYMSGTTLQELLGERQSLSEEETSNIICQLCTILEALHNAHPPIIHRDIKPSNIIISPDGVVKLIDMNAAKWSRDIVGHDTLLIGPAGYAAPEQYGFAASDTKTDVYSIGVLINVMLTGVPPVERLAREPMGHIVSRCTKMDPKERYDSISDVRRAVLDSKSEPDSADNRIRCRYAPPGFRTLRPLSMFFSAIGYRHAEIPAGKDHRPRPD